MKFLGERFDLAMASVNKAANHFSGVRVLQDPGERKLSVLSLPVSRCGLLGKLSEGTQMRGAVKRGVPISLTPKARIPQLTRMSLGPLVPAVFLDSSNPVRRVNPQEIWRLSQLASVIVLISKVSGRNLALVGSDCNIFPDPDCVRLGSVHRMRECRQLDAGSRHGSTARDRHTALTWSEPVTGNAP